MNRLASLSALALLACACTSRASAPPVSANARPAAESQPPATQAAVKLRRFYLLSPGPKETLVVTRSDVANTSP